MNTRHRLNRLERAIRGNRRAPQSAEEMTDDELLAAAGFPKRAAEMTEADWLQVEAVARAAEED